MPSKSKKQQKFFGMVTAFKKGELDTKGMDKELVYKIKKATGSMKAKDVKDFAETKHKGLPEKVKKENRIVRFDDYLNESFPSLDFKKLKREIIPNRDEKRVMKSGKETAQDYAKKYKTYHMASKAFKDNIINFKPFSVKGDVTDAFIDEFWKELKKIFKENV